MSGWRWVSHRAALTAHAEQIAEHGGGAGIRDMGLFESAMARPQQLEAYGEPDAAALAAAYAFGLAAGELSEDELADWFRQRVVAVG